MTFTANGTTFIDSSRGANTNALNAFGENSYLEVLSLPNAVGETSGYTSGGTDASSRLNTIDKFPFASDANATDVGDLTQAISHAAGQSSTVSGYTSGGTFPLSNIIDKFPFATNANATDVGDLTQGKYALAGQSSTVSGYTSGGTPFPVSLGIYNIIDKFPFATDGNASDVGDLTVARYGPAGQSSTFSGYTSAGYTPVSVSNVIDKFPFATNANATDVGDLTQGRNFVGGQSSLVSGYTSGGSPSRVNTIDKFPFASNANATDVGDLTVAREDLTGQSSTVSGYSSGGFSPAPVLVLALNIIEKFPFATDGNATDVGDLTVARKSSSGQQD